MVNSEHVKSEQIAPQWLFTWLAFKLFLAYHSLSQLGLCKNKMKWDHCYSACRHNSELYEQGWQYKIFQDLRCNGGDKQIGWNIQDGNWRACSPSLEGRAGAGNYITGSSEGCWNVTGDSMSEDSIWPPWTGSFHGARVPALSSGYHAGMQVGGDEVLSGISWEAHPSLGVLVFCDLEIGLPWWLRG